MTTTEGQPGRSQPVAAGTPVTTSVTTRSTLVNLTSMRLDYKIAPASGQPPKLEGFLDPGASLAVDSAAFPLSLMLGDGSTGTDLTPTPIQVSASDAPFAILPRHVRGTPVTATAPKTTVTVRNTSAHRFIQILQVVDADGTEKPVASCPPLAPHVAVIASVTVGSVILARSVFSGALGTMAVVGSGPIELRADPMDDTDDSAQSLVLANDRLSKPVPGFENMSLVSFDSHGSAHTPADRRYVQVTSSLKHQVPPPGIPKRFNTRVYDTLRHVTISGVELHWSPRDDQGLMAYQGEDVLNLAELTIVADRVCIDAPLRFPGTDVTIWARSLEIGPMGSISTSPQDWITVAASARVDDKGVPLDVDGKPTYEAADGAHGEAGGELTLHVKDLLLPPGDDVRFTTRGGKGQRGEAGGWKRYECSDKGRPPTAAGKSLAPVCAEDVTEALKARSESFDHWSWPDRASGPADLKTGTEQLFPPKGTTDAGAAPAGSVVYARIVGQHVVTRGFGPYGGTASMCEFNWVAQQRRDGADGKVSYAVGHRHHTQIGSWDGGKIMRDHPALGQVDADGGKLGDELPPPLVLPGNGEDAYQGGKPGRGGEAGNLTSSVPIPATACDLRGGEPGEETSQVLGAPPGTPSIKKADGTWVTRWVALLAAASTDTRPVMTVNEVQLKAGRDAPERTGISLLRKKPKQAGIHATASTIDSRGTLTCLPVGQPGEWLSPMLLSGVQNYAADAFRNGDRANARKVLEPYLAELAATPTLDSGHDAQWQHMRSMRRCLLDNLDYFGHPPGWVPRLNALANFLVMQDMRRVSLHLRAFAGKAIDEFDVREDRMQNLASTLCALQAHLASSRRQLGRQVASLLDARADLLDAENALVAWKNQLDGLVADITQQAEDKVQAARTVDAVLKFLGAGLRLLPIGQPYVGLGGSALSALGDIDWAKNDRTEDWNKALHTLGGNVDSFIKDNQELITSDLTASTRKRLSGVLPGLDVSTGQALDDQITAQNGAASNLAATSTKAAALAAKADPVAAAQADVDELQARVDRLGKTLALPGDPDDPGAAAARAKTQAAFDLATARLGRAKTALAEAKTAAATQEADQQTKAEADLKAVQDLQKKELDDLTARTKENLKRMAGLGKGLGDLGDAIALTRTVSASDPDVAAIVADLEQHGEQAKTFATLNTQVKEIGAKQAQAAARLSALQSAIGVRVAELSADLDRVATLAAGRGALATSLDTSVRQALVDMAARAEDLVRWSVYDFVLALRYELVQDLPVDLLDVQHLIDQLTARVAEGGGPTSVWSLDEKAYAEAEKTVLLAALQGIVAQRIQRMQSRLLRQSRTGLPRVIRMPAKADDSADYRILTELNSTGRAVASCVADLGIVTPSPLYTGARLSGVSLTAMTFRSTPPIGSHCTLRIRHVGRAVILERPEHSPTPVPYFFQSGPDDDPVQWSFTWTSGADEKGVLTPDTDDLRSSGLLGDILSQLMPRTDGGGKPLDPKTFQVYEPGLYSSLVLTWERPVGFPALTGLSLAFSMTYTGEVD